MELKVSLKTKGDIERFILIANIGLMTAIKEGVISIEEAENYLYSPYSVERIKHLDINMDVIRMVELGCELEDVESLIPDKLNNSIDEISNTSIELLRLIHKPIPPLIKWID
ncbi:MAG: DUF3969 family protein [Syntrophomonadaceae bacterium]|nr:DUF3969 family protein [Syntrophomonadaceae bacterium]